MLIFLRLAFHLLLFTTALISHAVCFAQTDAFSVHDSDEDSVDIGLDIYLGYEQQQQQHQDAEQTSVSFNPYLTLGNWYWGADVPWQSVDGAYSYNIPAQLAQTCTRLANGLPTRIRRQRVLDLITQTCKTLANNNFSDNGVGDISLTAHYGNWLDHKNQWRASAGVSYKADNADYENYLGSGTQDLNFDISLLGNFEIFSTSFYTGKTFIIGGDLEDIYSDILRFGSTLGTPWSKQWQLSVGWEYQDFGEDDLHRWQLASGFDWGKYSHLELTYSYYDSDSYFVDSQLGVSIAFYF